MTIAISKPTESNINHAEFDTNQVWEFHPDANDIQTKNTPHKEYLDAAYNKYMEENPDYYKNGNSSYYHTAENILFSEGYSKDVYDDSDGNKTVGVGFNLEKDTGLTEEQKAYLKDPSRTKQDQFDFFVKYLLDNVRKEAKVACYKENLDPDVFGICMEMTFNMGLPKFLGFKQTLKGINTGNLKLAAEEIVDNKNVKDAIAAQKDPDIRNIDGVLVRYYGYQHRLLNLITNHERLKKNIASSQY